MKILLVTLAYDPGFAFGGPVKVVQNYARELVRRGHHVTVYCTNHLDRRRKLSAGTVERQDQGVRVVYHNTWFIPHWRGNAGPFFSLGMINYLLREGKKYHVIHINDFRTFSTLVAGLYAQAAKIPYLIQAHGAFIYGFRHQHLKRFYDALIGRRIARGAAKVIALTSGEINECLAVGVPCEKIVVIDNGIDLSSWDIDKDEGRKFRIRWGIPLNALLILFLGRIDKIKGPDLLVEALNQLKAKDIYCVIAGPDDGYMEYTKKMVTIYGLSHRVIFTGPLEGRELMAAYASADIFALPSRFDTFPMAIVEALASGIPVLTTDTCQIAALIKDRAGIVVPVDPGAIANGLEQLLNPTLRKTYAQAAKELAEAELSLSRIVDRLEEIYNQVIQEARLL